MVTIESKDFDKFLRQVKYKIRSAIIQGSANTMKDGVSFGFSQNIATGQTLNEWNNSAVIDGLADTKRIVIGRFSSPAPILLQKGQEVLSQYGYPKFEYIPDWVEAKGLQNVFPFGYVRVGGDGTRYGTPINRWFDYAIFFTKENLKGYGKEELNKINA